MPSFNLPDQFSYWVCRTIFQLVWGFIHASVEEFSVRYNDPSITNVSISFWHRSVYCGNITHFAISVPMHYTVIDKTHFSIWFGHNVLMLNVFRQCIYYCTITHVPTSCCVYVKHVHSRTHNIHTTPAYVLLSVFITHTLTHTHYLPHALTHMYAIPPSSRTHGQINLILIKPENIFRTGPLYNCLCQTYRTSQVTLSFSL